MDLVALEIFRAVAAEGSVTLAARRLGRAQSNLSTRLAQLEAELGATLFSRQNRRMTLTAEGERFLAYAHRLAGLAEEARQAVRPGLVEGRLRIGSMESTAAARLPAPLAECHSRWPGLRLLVSTGPSRGLVRGVLAGTLDCALYAPLIAQGVDVDADPALETEPLFEEELVLVLPPGHRRVRRAADVEPRAIAAFAAGCTYRAIAEEWLDDGRPLHVHEVGSYHAMLACVAAGGCVSVLPRSVLATLREPPGLDTVALARVPVWLGWRRGYDTPAFHALRETLREAARRARLSRRRWA